MKTVTSNYIVKAIHQALSRPHQYTPVLNGSYILTLADPKRTRVEVGNISFVSDGKTVRFQGVQYWNGYQKEVSYELALDGPVGVVSNESGKLWKD